MIEAPPPEPVPVAAHLQLSIEPLSDTSRYEQLGVVMHIEALQALLKQLKLYGMRQSVQDLSLQSAPAWQHALPILDILLKAEVADREVRSVAYQMSAARFPAYRDLYGFNFQESEVDERLVQDLHRCDFIQSSQNIVLVGGPGTGKTHLATALGVQAIQHHQLRVRFISTLELVNALELENAKTKPTG